MPQPTFVRATGAGRAVRFGGRALPNGQGTMPWLNLNDWSSWFLQNIAKDSAQELGIGRLAQRGRSSILSSDFPPESIVLSYEYREVTAALGAALALLSQAGDQYLAFDPASTAVIPARYAGIHNRQAVTLAPHVPRWSFDLEFACTQQFISDLSATNLTTVNLINAPTAAPSGSPTAGGALTAGTYKLRFAYVTSSGTTAVSPASSNIVLSGGNLQISVSSVTPLPAFASAVRWYFDTGSPTTGFTVQNSGGAFTLNTVGDGTTIPTVTPATSFSVTYAGSVWTEPIWTLTIPSSNPGVITSLTLANTMKGETLVVNFPGGLSASTAYTITIDCGTYSVTDNSGKAYDVLGSFPNLYEPAGQVNPFTVLASTSSGVPALLTLGGSWAARWEL